jgi:dihydroxyacetone kinase phosphoprotein-dependent L subunit
MTGSILRESILAAAGAVEAARDELTRLDSVAGDGDHGVTMTLAARAVRQKLEQSPNVDGADLLVQVAQAIGSVGGAIGPLYATALLRVARTIRSLEPTDVRPTSGDLLRCAEAAEAGITELGGAQPGDKTMVDALRPAVEALRQAEAAGLDPRQALSAAAHAARDGAESTRGMVAKIGRASRLGERSRGAPDAGATSLALILEAASGVYAPTVSEGVRP